MTQQVTLEELLGHLKRIPAKWLDEEGTHVLETISRVVNELGIPPVNSDLIKDILRKEPYALDVFRLILDLSQDDLENEMRPRGIKGRFKICREKCKKDPGKIANVLLELGLIDAIEAHLSHQWTLDDVLWDRYGHMRGRAMAAQHRGSALEDAIEDILKELQEEINLHYRTYAVAPPTNE